MEEIETGVREIMRVFGPDGHTDGADKIALFIQYLLDGHTPQDAESFVQKTGPIWT